MDSLYSDGDMPVCRLKKLLNVDWFGKPVSRTTSLISNSALRNMAFISSMMYSAMQSLADCPLISSIIIVKYLGDIHSLSA